MGSEHDWADIASTLSTAVPKLNQALKSDAQFKAFVATDAITKSITFGIKSSGSDNAILVTFDNGNGSAFTGSSQKASFSLVAHPQQWKEFFKDTPISPYQSYWGMFGMNIKQQGVEVEGSEDGFVQFTHVWRRVLELLHDAHCGPAKTDEQPEQNEDHLVGRYTWIEAPVWGKCKVFYEHSGTGDQDIVFLHTAGSDGRQYNGVMNDIRMRQKCNMYCFDLPGHGRSFPSQSYAFGAHTNNEDAYVGAIASFVKALKLKKPIICGASMAGQVCLNVAARYKEVGASGTIPLQGNDHLEMKRQWFDKSPYVNQSLFNPEWVYGMMSPTAPLINKQLIWHLYSGQAYSMFHGDLDYYFNGWDGRDRMSKIDTKACPVFMLTGEYDWSNTPEISEAVVKKIPGGKHKVMPELGHFPATENPAKFIPHLIEAIDHIQATRA